MRACGVRCEGVNLFLADGAAAGQAVGHVHLHVIPRCAADGCRLTIPYDLRPTHAALEEVATQRRAAL